MKTIKVGDIVSRKSYGNDIIFYVKKILRTSQKDIAILCGLKERIEADSYLEDLEILDKELINRIIDEENIKNEKRIIDSEKKYIQRIENRENKKFITGRILHLDGDKRYSQKSYYYYKKLKLDAVVKNIPEFLQPQQVYRLLKIYNPDILIITGHDGMIKKEKNYNDINNYRNSKYFIDTVKEARRYDRENGKDTAIFARSLSKLL